MGFWQQVFKFVVWVAAIGALVLGVLKVLYVDAYVVGHDAMAPTMIAGEKVLAWRTKNLEFGDIAVCENPSLPGVLVMGRLVGARPGQVIGATNGALRIADQTPDIDWGEHTRFVDSRTGVAEDVRLGVEALGGGHHQIQMREHAPFGFRDVTLGPGEAFLLSDYRTFPGQDSRTFGPVRLDSCRARVFMRVEAADDRGADLGHGRFEWLK